MTKPMTLDLTPSEAARRDLVESGGSAVANLRTDHALIAWAKTQKVFVRIDRRSVWGNPFRIGTDGDRATVIDRYRAYLLASPQLLARLPELRGKLLGCWCHPEPCHGCVLLQQLAEVSHCRL